MGEFLKDLAAGETVEMEAAQRLAKFWKPRGYLPVLHEREKSHDIKLVHRTHRPILVEVKYDRKSQETGNIAIEFYCSYQFSGIATTKADFWVFKYWRANGWHWRAIPTAKLIKEWKSRWYPAVYGGDECRARLILVPVQVLSTWGVTL